MPAFAVALLCAASCGAASAFAPAARPRSMRPVAARRFALPADLSDVALSRFLTQRAVQQCVYFAELSRDETMGRYFEEFAMPAGTALGTDYHGTDALPLNSTAYLCAMLDAPEEEITIKRPMGCAAGGGGSGINGRTGEPIPPNPFREKRCVPCAAAEL